jgi:hypothetical protein
MRALVTRYVGRTEKKPARIEVKSYRGKKLFTYDSKLEALEAHRVAAASYVDSLNEEDEARFPRAAATWILDPNMWAESVDQKGYVFAMTGKVTA